MDRLCRREGLDSLILTSVPVLLKALTSSWRLLSANNSFLALMCGLIGSGDLLVAADPVFRPEAFVLDGEAAKTSALTGIDPGLLTKTDPPERTPSFPGRVQ